MRIPLRLKLSTEIPVHLRPRCGQEKITGRLHLKPIDWTYDKPLEALITESQSNQEDYWMIANPGFDANSLIASAEASADLVVYRDSPGTQRWSRLNRCLPAGLYFLAIRPSDHPAIAISAKSIAANASRFVESHSLDDLVTRVAESATVSFIDDLKVSTESTFQLPSLSFAGVEPGEPQVGEKIHAISPRSLKTGNATAVSALKAGLFLLNRFFDDSHSCSQSIEGMGPNHTGDYWHAILHRREPDYGNAKYWFRHVGRHPVYVELSKLVSQRLNEAGHSVETKLQRWKSRLISRDSWEPFAFVDLCEAAENDADLRVWCEQIQYDEMLLLLESSAKDVFGH